MKTPHFSWKTRDPRLWLATALILLLGLASYCTYALPVFRGQLRGYLDLSEAQFGLLLSIGAVPGALGALLTGFWSRRRGVNLLLPLALAAISLSFLGLSWSRAYVLIILLLGWLSFASNSFVVCVQSHLVALFPDQRRRVLALQMAGTSACGMAFVLLAENLLAWHNRGQASFALVFHLPLFIMGTTLLLSSLGLRLFVGRLPTGAPPAAVPVSAPSTRPSSSARLNPLVLAIMAALVLHSVADTVLVYWLPRLLELPAHQSIKPGYVLGASSFGYLGSRIILGMMPEKSFRRALLILPGLLGGVFWLLGLSQGGLWTALFYIAGACCWSCEYPVFLAILGDLAPRSFPALLAIVMLFSGLGITTLSTCFGWLWEQGTLPLPAILAMPGMMFATVGVIGAGIAGRKTN